MELVTIVLAYAHVLSALAWIGGGLTFGFFIAPKLSKVSISTSREFLVTIVPGVIRFFQIVAGLTILTGVLLLWSVTGGDWNQLNPSGLWGLRITLGISVAIVAFVFAETVAAPTFLKLVELNRKMNPDGSNMPPELPRTAKRAAPVTLVIALLLLTALAFMVSAGFT